MQNNDNIITFNREWQKGKHEKLFKNANLVDINTGQVELVDILVDDTKISRIEPVGQISCDNCYDLRGSFVLPGFLNAFIDFENVEYGEFLNPKAKKDFITVMELKNYLAGVTKIEWGPTLENVDELEELDLTAISCKMAKGGKVFLKVGQDLDELGTVDKKYGKALAYVLEDFGFLDRDFVLVGGNCLEKDDLKIFLEYKNQFVVCPSEDAKMGRRATNLISLKNLGFETKIGSGRAFEIDFFGFMRQILMTQWAIFEDNTCISEQEVLKMALVQPCLQTNMNADFIVIKNTPSLYPDIFKTLVWGKSKSDIITTICNGQIYQVSGQMTCNGKKYLQILESIKQKWGELK